MKPRTPRAEVSLPATLLDGRVSKEAIVLNVSHRGLALRAAMPPGRGSYIELRTANQLIVARVAWAEGENFGVRTQDPVPDALLRCGPGVEVPVDLQVLPRLSSVALENRNGALGWQMQAVSFIIIAAAAAWVAFSGVAIRLGDPMTVISDALSH